ncbi:C3 and PZP-like alpha-2-macroglobulin domain-containing protein 8 [Wyeomyia smithii]|uniref:C3 and PZP-like alpha-2-macroglobulin domain-containing protein 8 n=1 Tax=Wyeomyia smithii TaxID=174621 RepID=UPI002467D495|nr:C3 and PZP-like alpha-2-macroglobulin domain-containing protein 8 [Wyeomyia smithii]
MLKYTFYPATSGVVNFKTRASNDAHLASTSGPAESNPMLEVFIGGWKNTKSAIRKNRAKPDVSEAYIPGILSVGQYRGFWIKWIDDVITVGMEGARVAFLSYKNSDPFPINFVGVCTGYGASGSWIIQQNKSGPLASPALVSDAAPSSVPTDAIR